MSNRIYVFSNKTPFSAETRKVLLDKLDKAGFQVSETYDDDIDLLICLGGDGTFLEAIHTYSFPQMPIIGINTGHLGFFQEIMPDQIDDFIKDYKAGDFILQQLSTVKLSIETAHGTYSHVGLNEMCIKAAESYSVHLDMSIGGSFIERFSGDGILVSTPAGSTAYNYSLGGGIVDPRLDLLQVTPVAPMNTTAYRAFTSSILLPSDLTLGLIPAMEVDSEIAVIRDGITTIYNDVKEMTIGYSDITVNLVRFEGYDFWSKVKSKFL